MVTPTTKSPTCTMTRSTFPRIFQDDSTGGDNASGSISAVESSLPVSTFCSGAPAYIAPEPLVSRPIFKP